MQRGVLAIGAALLSLYGAAMLTLWWQQESLIFVPTPLPAEHRFKQMADVQERFIDVPGARLNALHMQMPQARGVVFYLHGNSGNLENWFVNTEFYRSMNMDLFMLDYRGFGKSTGVNTSEAQLLADAQAAWAAIAPLYAGRTVVFIGRSLGTGVAARMTAALPEDQRPDLLMLVSPYLSMQAMAKANYPYVPGALLRYPLHTDEALLAMKGQQPRVVLLHGDRDALIPYAHSETLAQSVPGVQLVRIPGAGHNDVQAYPAYLDAVRQAIEAAATPLLR